MPFTLAHPSAILYFKHKFKLLSATGLVTGSLGPDLGYYAKFQITSRLEHSWILSAFIVIPFTILFSVLYHCLVKRQLIKNLPLYFKSRMTRWIDFNFIDYLKENYWAYVFSALIGIYTHLLWDSFTHDTGFFVQQFMFLQTESFGFPIFKWLQYGCSVAGMAVLGIYFHHLESNRHVKASHSAKYILLTAFSTLSMILIRLLFFPIPIKIGNILVVSMSALFFSFCIVGLFAQVLNPSILKSKKN